MSTSLARSATGLTDKEIQHLFHTLKREADGMAGPSELDVAAWRDRQQQLLAAMGRMSEAKKEALSRKLFASRGEPVPDGATFYAWSRIESRARQEVAVRAVATAVDLEPPGSQADQYEVGEDGRPTRVYYASYGSNLNRDRFMSYIEGGRPPGSSRKYDGCVDTTAPTDDIPIRFAGSRPHFALTSRVWRGGIAFIDAQKGESAVGLGRAYNISIEQFDQVVNQENGGLGKKAPAVPLDEALKTGRAVTGEGAYETVLHIGDYNGAPVLTFTAPFSTRDAMVHEGHIVRAGVKMPVRTNKPSAAYVRMIGGGLQETFGMDEVAQADYIRGCPGGDRWSRRDLIKVLRGQTTELPVENTSPAHSGYTQVSGGGRVITGQPSGKGKGKGKGKGSPRVAFSSEDSAGIRDALDRMRAYEEANGQQRLSNPLPPAGGRGGSRPAGGERRPSDVHPGVKRYATQEEQATGVARWKATLDEATDKVQKLREEHQVETRAHAILIGQGDKDAARRVEHKMGTIDQELVQAVLAEEELKRKHRAAMAQTPPLAAQARPVAAEPRPAGKRRSGGKRPAPGSRTERLGPVNARSADRWQSLSDDLHRQWAKADRDCVDAEAAYQAAETSGEDTTSLGKTLRAVRAKRAYLEHDAREADLKVQRARETAAGK